MGSRFLQGDGYPILKRYNSSNTLQETVNLPYVRDDNSNSFVKQILEPYPADSIRQYMLLSGSDAEDAPTGYKLKIQIKYVSILASDLKAIFDCIFNARANAGHYLKLQPRSDYDTTAVDYKVIYRGSFPIESANMWRHNVALEFITTDLLAISFAFSTTSDIVISFGLFGGGSVGSASDNTDKYDYASDAVTAGTVLGLAREKLSAVGNVTVGIFGGGFTAAYSDYTDKYTYATDAVSASTVLGLARNALAAVGNATNGIFGGGYDGSNSNYTDKYAYSTDVIVAGTSLGLSREGVAATGNTTFGIFGNGFGTSQSKYTDKYTYSSDAVVAGTILLTARYNASATGNSTMGLFSGGWALNVAVDKYVYADDTVVSGTVLGTAKQKMGATGNGTVGIFGGGYGVDSIDSFTTEKYTYADDSVVAGTVLGLARSGLAACSSAANGL